MTDWIRGRVTRRTAWNATHFSLHIACDRPDFKAGQFVRVALDIDGERIARPYSCVNSPDQPGVEILFNTIPDGPLSNRLAQLEPGDKLWLGDSMHGFLTLANVPAPAHDLWMIATGTGVGPFLSILQTDEPWQRFERVVLAYGVRKVEDLTYTDLLDQLLATYSRRLRVIPCVTGEPPGIGVHGRVTEALRSGELEKLAERGVDPASSHFLLCGNQNMIAEMSELLGRRGMQRNLRRDPGQFSSEKYH